MTNRQCSCTQSSVHEQKGKDINLTFDNQNGDGLVIQNIVYGQNIENFTIPSKEGYDFSGYYDKETNGTIVFNEQMEWEYNLNLVNNSTLYAYYKGVEYQVEFNSNNGLNQTTTQSLNYAETKALDLNTFEKTGYEFNGWNTNADGSGTSYDDGARVLNLTNTKNSVVKLYAQWSPKTITVILSDEYINYTPEVLVEFNLNGASGSIPSQTVTSTIGLTYPDIPTRSDYLFAGWYDNSSCSGTPFDFTSDITDDLTLYANWIAISSKATPLKFGNNNIYINGGVNNYYAFISPITQSVTINIGKNAYISGVDTKVSDPETIKKYNTATFNCTANVLYYICIESHMNDTSSEYVGNTYLNLVADQMTPDSGGTSLKKEFASVDLAYDSNFNLIIPTKVGYIFMGWYDGENGTGTKYTNSLGESVRVWDKDTASLLYSKWQPIETTITFDKQNGTGGTNEVNVIYDEDMPSATAPTKVGYTFNGYYDSITGGVKYYNSDMTSTKQCDLVEDTTLYARWSGNSYTISYDNQNDDAIFDETVVYDELLPTLSMPTKPGYTFIGYYDAIDGGTKYYDENATSTLTWSNTNNITLYARWSINKYTINFNSNQGSGAQTPVEATYDSNMPDITSKPIREGYIFLGYFDSVIDGTKYYDADLSSAHVMDKTSNTTLYAHWQGVPYYISFNANTGTGEMDNQELIYGTQSQLTNNLFTKTGYNFVNWNTNADGSGTSYDDAASVLNLSNIKDSTITLYAIWSPKEVKVSLFDTIDTTGNVDVNFDLNGASGSIPSQTVTKTTGLTYPDIPTRTGYVFAGWYDNSSCSGTPYDFISDISEDITLYAKWISHTGYGALSVGYNSSMTFPVRDNKRYYAFVPLVSGNITIYSTGSSDTYGYLYDVNKNQLSSNDDDGEGNNFKITYNVTAGTLYYIAPCAYSTTSSCNATLHIEGTIKPNDGGIYTFGSSILTYDDSFTLLTPSKEHYNFGGWYDGENGTGIQYTDNSGNSIINWDKEESTILYPKWIPIKYNINYNLNGGINNTNNSETYDIETDNYTLSYPTKDGYSFIGWTTPTSSTPIKDYVINKGTTGDISVTANWAEYNIGNITYDDSVNVIGIECSDVLKQFNVECIDTSSEKVEVTYQFSKTLVVGDTISISFTASNNGISKTITINNILVCDVPTISVNKTSIKFTDEITKEKFEVTAKDYANNDLDVTIELISGDLTTGGQRIYRFSCIDSGGNECSTDVEVKVYKLEDIESTFTFKEGITAIKLSGNGIEFEARAKDTFNVDCIISIDTLIEAGHEYNLVLCATDAAGNKAIETIPGVKVYGTPTYTKILEEVTDKTLASNIFKVTDSFGKVLDATVTFGGPVTPGENVVVRIYCEDSVGNILNEEIPVFVYCTSHTIGEACTCQICGKIEHTYEGTDVCLICHSHK